MKNTYSATIKMSSAEQLAAFIDSVGPLVESVVITTTPVERAIAAPVTKQTVPYKTRVSKVNESILRTMRHSGSATVKELKEALEAVNLSAGSLSTGIAYLTKSGQIARVGEGVYAIAGGVQQAAE
jgi:predicted HTH transcriptional regulator